MSPEAENPPTIERLIALLSAGYQMDVQSSAASGDLVNFVHPASWRRVPETQLFLSQNGDVFGLRPDENGRSLLIRADDDEMFRRFVSNVPYPTWWELNHRPFYAVLAWILFICAGLGGMIILTVLWRLFSSR